MPLFLGRPNKAVEAPKLRVRPLKKPSLFHTFTITAS
jgi:hypothetical protein